MVHLLYAHIVCTFIVFKIPWWFHQLSELSFFFSSLKGRSCVSNRSTLLSLQLFRTSSVDSKPPSLAPQSLCGWTFLHCQKRSEILHPVVSFESLYDKMCYKSQNMDHSTQFPVLTLLKQTLSFISFFNTESNYTQLTTVAQDGCTFSVLSS